MGWVSAQSRTDDCRLILHDGLSYPGVEANLESVEEIERSRGNPLNPGGPVLGFDTRGTEAGRAMLSRARSGGFGGGRPAMRTRLCDLSEVNMTAEEYQMREECARPAPRAGMGSRLVASLWRDLAKDVARPWAIGAMLCCHVYPLPRSNRVS